MTWHFFIGMVLSFIVGTLFGIYTVSVGWANGRSTCTGDCNQGRNCTCGGGQ